LKQKRLNTIHEFGHDIYVPLEASKKGMFGVPTAEFDVQGPGKINIYALKTWTPGPLLEGLRRKSFKGRLTPGWFSKMNMFKSTAAAFGKNWGQANSFKSSDFLAGRDSHSTGQTGYQ